MSNVGLFLNPAGLPQECWRPAPKENHRIGDRMNEREIERIPVWIQIPGSADWQPIRLRDYSLLGFGIYFNSHQDRAFPISVHDSVLLKFSNSRNQECTVPCVVQNLGDVFEGHRLGLKRLDISTCLQGPYNTFQNKFFMNQPKSLPSRILNPYLFDEWAMAECIGIGPENTLLFNTTDHTLFLLPGQSLKISMELASAADGLFDGVLLWCIKQQDDSIHFSVTPKNMSFEINNALAEHILQDWGRKPEELKSCGFQIRHFKNQLDFSFVSTQEEYSQVLMLRRNAYVHAGKCESKTVPEHLTSLHDPHSRILAAYHNKEMVASLTMNFGKHGTSPFRSEGEFPGNKYPVALPPKEKMIEVYSACTHKDYRGGDLLRGMIEHTVRTLLLSDRDWIITLVTDELWLLYQRMGCKKVGASVQIRHLNNIEHHLILIHRNAVLYGTGMNILDWNYFYSDLMKDMLKKRMLLIPPWRKIGMLGLLSLAALSSKWLSRKREKEFQKYLRNLNDKEILK